MIEETTKLGSALTRRTLLQRTGSGLVVVGGAGWLAACGGGDSDTGSSAAPAASGAANDGTPVKGGTLRLGASGGGNTDVLEAQNLVTNADYARGFALYDGLTRLDAKGQVQMSMAESIEPNAKGTQWTIKLRDGIVDHSGKPFEAKDVLYSFKRIVAKKFPGIYALGPIDLKASKVVDKTTLRVAFKKPFGTFPQGLALIYCFMVPEGYDPKKPIGTGAFKFQSFTPGQESTFVRNEQYWNEGKPYLDKLVITNIADETAQINALQSGQVDAVDYLSATSVAAVQAANAKLIVSKTGAWGPITMRVDQAPFDDNRVRTALKLVIDRKQMNEQVFSGYGTIGNDVFGTFDSDFDKSIPQREQDLDQAKSLLKAAGKSDLRIELVTTANAPGQVQAAQVFATQAKGAGVTVKITNQSPTDYFAKSYLKVPFSQDFWPYQPYLVAASQAVIKGAPFSATHQEDPKYDALYDKASGTVDDAERKQAIGEMLKYDHDNSGNIIPYQFPVIDAVSAKVKGVTPSVTGVALGQFDWSNIWMQS